MDRNLPRRLSVVFLLCAAFFARSAFPQVAWVKKYDDALRQAAAEGKFVIIDVSAAWCPPCRRMEREVHPNAEFIEFSRSQVFMLVDEADPEGMRIAGRFRVQSYPTILVLNSKGDEIDRLVGGRDARTLIGDLKKLLAHPVPYGEAVKQASARPDDFEVQYSTGNRALDRGDYQRARQFLARASSLSAGRSMEERTLTLAYLATACFRDGKYQDSLHALDALERLDAKLAESVPELKLQRARALVSLKKYDEAYAVLGDYLRGSHSRSEADGARKILAELPGKYRKGDRDYTAAIEKAKENLRKGNPDAALEFASKAAELAPQAAEAHFMLAATHFSASSRESDTQKKSERLSTGLHELRLSRRLDPEDLGTFQNARRYIASAYIPQEPGSPEAKKAYAEAEQRFAEARYDDAAKAYLRVIKAEPRFGKAYLHLGDCFFTAGSLEEAMKYYKLASSVTPLDASTYRFTADTLLRLGKPEEAREYVFQSILADPEYPLAWLNLEQDARGRGLNMERHTHIVPHQFLGVDESRYDEKLFDNVPQETVPAWREYVKAKLLWRRSKFPAAFPKEQFYHTSFPEEFEALQELVKSWSALKESNPDLRDENLDFVRQAAVGGMLDALVFLELYTEEYRPQYEDWKKKNRDRAIAYLNGYVLNAAQARSRGEYNSSAIDAYNAGVKSHQAGDHAAALEMYEKALAQEPRMIPALSNSVSIHMAAGGYERARPLLRRWSEADAGAAQPLALLGQIEINGGNIEAGAALLQKAAELETDPERKASYSDLLARIRPGSVSKVETRAAPAVSGESDPIRRLEQRLAASSDGSEKDWLHLMLGISHFQAQHWKEARVYLEKVLEKDPDNLSAREMMKTIQSAESPK